MMKQLKLSREEAHFLLEYIKMEDCMAKRNIEMLCAKELNKLSQEQVLIQIIES